MGILKMSESNLWDALRTTVDSQVDTNKKLWGALTELLNKVQALEKRVAAKELFQAACEELGESALHGETHKREIAKLKLESDRRARRVAERMLALCHAAVIGYPYISDTQMSGLRWAMDGINIEALVDESKL